MIRDYRGEQKRSNLLGWKGENCFRTVTYGADIYRNQNDQIK